MNLNKLFDQCFLDAAAELGESAMVSAVREKALAEFLKRAKPDVTTSIPPATFKQDTPRDQGTTILGAVKGLLDNLKDGTTPPEKTLELLASPIRDLEILHQGWLKGGW